MTCHERRSSVSNMLTPSRKPEARRKASKQVVENGAYMDMMVRCIRSLGRRIAAGDVEDIGRALELRKMLDDELTQAIRKLNDAGESWARIGRGAGITKQTAQVRWGRKHDNT